MENLRGLRPKGTYTLLCFIGIFAINMYHGYGFKLLILVTEARTKHSQKIKRTPIILLSELMPTIFLPSPLKRALYAKDTKCFPISFSSFS